MTKSYFVRDNRTGRYLNTASPPALAARSTLSGDPAAAGGQVARFDTEELATAAIPSGSSCSIRSMSYPDPKGEPDPV